jgi:CPA1 family monovalent cation:H+ antiporter|tara:strand:- start:4821 stop:7268 length:2448 start_codon:yes stop_codon:yes gene_type:complete
MLVAALTTMMSKRLYWLPLTIALVLIGICISYLADTYGADSELLGIIAEFELTPELVLFVFIPTLIFESAFNLDARQVSRNIMPILTLAVPGLIVSTVIIGVIMLLLAGQFNDLLVALLLGAILSATDPVAVIAIFKQLGVPERLTVLVEGESLFNDATSLVMAMLLVEILLAGSFSGAVIVDGVATFFKVFVGGVVVGWMAAVIVAETLGKIEADTFIEITLTTILAYFSFIVAEHVLHVSGIMAVVAAGLTIGSWGKSKISPSTAEFMEHFWEYLAALANGLIFLLVGIQMDLVHMWESVGLIALVVGAMLFSRAVVVFALVPMVGRLPRSEAIGSAFQKVMYWGGLRGAIALAIVLSLPAQFEYKDTLTAIVMGAVLFTLLVQGLSIEVLVKWLGLDELTLADNLAKIEGDRTARKEGLDRVADLVRGGLFSERIAQHLREKCETSLAALDFAISQLHEGMGAEEEVKILGLRCLSREKARYYELFRRGLISEWAFRDLDYTVNVQIDEAKHQGNLPDAGIESSITKKLSLLFITALDAVPGFGRLVERMRTLRIVRDYDVAWGRYRATNSVLQRLDRIAEDNKIAGDAVEQVRRAYEDIRDHVKTQIDEVAELYPEFVDTVQEQLGERLLVIAEHESVEHAAELGILPEGIATKILKDQAERIRQIKQQELSSALVIEKDELLRKVAFLKDEDESVFTTFADYLRARTIPRGTAIVKQGQAGDSMFLIARGVAKVMVEEGDSEKHVATLYAGDIVGESALLHGKPRNATARAATPCSMYELKRVDLDKIFEVYPRIKVAVEEVDKERIGAG